MGGRGHDKLAWLLEVTYIRGGSIYVQMIPSRLPHSKYRIRWGGGGAYLGWLLGLTWGICAQTLKCFIMASWMWKLIDHTDTISELTLTEHKFCIYVDIIIFLSMCALVQVDYHHFVVTVNSIRPLWGLRRCLLSLPALSTMIFVVLCSWSTESIKLL